MKYFFKNIFVFVEEKNYCSYYGSGVIMVVGILYINLFSQSRLTFFS